MIPDISLPTLDGNTIQFGAKHGRRVVLACVREHQVLSRSLLADLQAEYEALREKSIDVIAVASGGGSPDYWRELVAQQGIQFPLALDADERLLKEIGSSALPVTFVVDQQAKVTSTIFLHRLSFARNLWRELRHAGLPEADERRQQIADAEARQSVLRHIQELVRAGQTDDALQAIAGIRSKYPNRFEIRIVLGKMLIDLGRPSEATKELLAAQKLEPTSLRARLWLGIAYARSGDDVQAEKLLTGVAEFMPDAWRAYGELGAIEYRREALKAAVGFYRKSLSGNPVLLWSTGGGWIGTAAPILDVKDLEGNPGLPVAHRSEPRPTVLLFWATEDKASLASLREVQSLHTQIETEKLSVLAVNVDGRWFSDDDRKRVRETIQQAGVTFPVWLDTNLESFARYDVSAIPTTVLVDSEGMVTQRIVGKAASGLSDLVHEEVGATTRPDRQPTTSAADQNSAKVLAGRYLAMARHLARQGRLEAAIESARRTMTTSPTLPGAASLLGRLLSASDRGDEAVQLLADASKDHPKSPGVLTAYADCLLRRGLTAEAKKQYRRALDMSEGDALAHLGIGQVMIAEGENEQALREARLAAKLNPHDERVFVLLGEVLESMDHHREAVEAFRRAYDTKWSRVGTWTRPR